MMVPILRKAILQHPWDTMTPCISAFQLSVQGMPLLCQGKMASDSHPPLPPIMVSCTPAGWGSGLEATTHLNSRGRCAVSSSARMGDSPPGFLACPQLIGLFSLTVAMPSASLLVPPSPLWRWLHRSDPSTSPCQQRRVPKSATWCLGALRNSWRTGAKCCLHASCASEVH